MNKADHESASKNTIELMAQSYQLVGVPAWIAAKQGLR